MNYNRVILAGNLTRDPALKYLPSQTAVVEFGIAINRKWKSADGDDREEVCFVDVAAFGKTGEIINEHFHKGKAILIEGRLRLDQWDDKQSGAKRSKLSVVCDSFQFVGGKNDDNGAPPQEKPRLRREDVISDKQEFTEADVPF